MAAPNNKPSSRWGSFLSQAVAGVESRLDNILGDEENGGAAVTGQATQQPQQQQPKLQPQMMTPTPVSAVPAAAKATPSKTPLCSRAHGGI